MTYSPHQLAYFAHQLTRRAASNSMDRMAGALLDAQVDLNPHQIDAALFATSNPLSKGAILADEVGLGKTIEAGLLIARSWSLINARRQCFDSARIFRRSCSACSSFRETVLVAVAPISLLQGNT